MSEFILKRRGLAAFAPYQGIDFVHSKSVMSKAGYLYR